jgi:hypothetical protein
MHITVSLAALQGRAQSHQTRIRLSSMEWLWAVLLHGNESDY